MAVYKRPSGPKPPRPRGSAGSAKLPGFKVTLGRVAGRRLVTDAQGNKVTYTNEAGKTWDYRQKKFVPTPTGMKRPGPLRKRSESTGMKRPGPLRKRG